MPRGPQPTAQGTTTAAAMRGDRAAIEALWQDNRRWVAAVILAHKPRSEDLEDLLQEVAMTLTAKINTLRDQSNVRAWLRAVAINTARAAGRSERSKPVVTMDQTDPAAADVHPTRTLEPREDAGHVLTLVERLPEAYREPLLLKALHGMRTRQISEILNLPEPTIDTRISRARRMLRELALQRHGMPDEMALAMKPA